MHLVRLIYASKTTPSSDPGDLHGLMKVAREKNEELGITGLLCYDGSAFLQWLEGPRDAVNQLYLTILRDWRHERITLIDYREVHQRAFPDWAMGYVSSEHFEKDLVLQYSVSAIFDPFIMSAESARLFMLDYGKRFVELVDV